MVFVIYNDNIQYIMTADLVVTIEAWRISFPHALSDLNLT